MIGYSGLGGRELLQLNKIMLVVKLIMATGLVLYKVAMTNQRLKLNSIDLAKCLIHNSKATRETYSPEMMVESVKIALKQWELQMS